MLGGVCLRRCLIKQHPKFLCEKLKSQPWLVQEPFFSIQLLFSLNTILFFWDTTGPPPGLKIAKRLFFGSFQESHSRIDLHVGCHPEKFYTGFLSHNFWGVTTHVEKSVTISASVSENRGSRKYFRYSCLAQGRLCILEWSIDLKFWFKA